MGLTLESKLAINPPRIHIQNEALPEPARELHVRYIEHAHTLVWRGLEITNLRRVRVSGVGARRSLCHILYVRRMTRAFGLALGP